MIICPEHNIMQICPSNKNTSVSFTGQIREDKDRKEPHSIPLLSPKSRNMEEIVKKCRPHLSGTRQEKKKFHLHPMKNTLPIMDRKLSQ